MLHTIQSIQKNRVQERIRMPAESRSRMCRVTGACVRRGPFDSRFSSNASPHFSALRVLACEQVRRPHPLLSNVDIDQAVSFPPAPNASNQTRLLDPGCTLASVWMRSLGFWHSNSSRRGPRLPPFHSHAAAKASKIRRWTHYGRRRIN